MEPRVADRKKQEIYSLLKQARINEAIKAITAFIEEAGAPGLNDELAQLSMSYSFMLQYLAKGIFDPQRDTVLQRIIESLYTIADRCAIAAQQDKSPAIFYTRRRELKDTSLVSLLDAFKASSHKMDLLSNVPKEQANRLAYMQILQERERQETAIFNKLWSTYPTTNDDTALLKGFIIDDKMPYHAKCLFLSALFLGLTVLYDESKLLLLIETYTVSNNPEVQIRALIYAVLALYLYGSRASRSAEVKSRTQAMAEDPHFATDMATLQFLLARSRNTDNVTRKVRDDLMPGIMNMSPDLINKIRNKNAPLDIADLEANPEWQDMLENSGIAKKMEEFNEMQLEGNDVFISTFSHLKSFPFFRTLSNWFLPYHSNHSVLHETFGDNSDTLNDIIGYAPLCNSDKYSFCLSMASIPESQRNMMTAQVQAQNSELKEMKSAELPSDDKQREAVANKHIQDLYRFFKLFSRKREFVAVFDQDMDFTTMPFFKDFTTTPQTLSIISEFYFKNALHEDAIKYYAYQLNTSENVNPIIFQKMGFSYQNLGNIKEALKHYKRYLLAHDNDPWTIKHMAACYKAAKRYDKAIEFYKLADELQPGSVAGTLNIANCLLESGNTVDALQYYYKADFLPGAKHKAWRPIAWCSFITGNTDKALAYYDKIIAEDKPTAQDYLNRGHVMLCTGNIPEAISNYTSSLSLEICQEDFRDAFFSDKQVLGDKGISTDDMALLIDAILFKPKD